ncbi:FMN-binding glutamate synthase family protein, partial [bacterium]|nr:FMN-binding glutamate synthase family protein [bacterium]
GWIESKDLPKAVSEFGNTPEEIYVTYAELKEKYGNDIKNIPLGAVGIYTFSQKIKVGLQQLMAGSRNFRINTISRKDIMSLTEEAAKVSGIPYVMDAYREEAEAVLGS